MDRRRFLEGVAAGAALSPVAALASTDGQAAEAVSVESLPELEGELTLYLGRGEGGLYEKILDAIRERNPKLDLEVRRGPSSALANTLVAEGQAGVSRADVFWSIDASSIGVVTENAPSRVLPASVRDQIKPEYRYEKWAPVSGRIRSIPYHTETLSPSDLPDDVMAFAESDLRIGWAPAYGAFQSFVTAMRVLRGEEATRRWLEGVRERATTYAGEFGVVMAAERGEIDVGFANHYYTLRLKQGKPDARVALAFTREDAGCLLNASGAVALTEGELPLLFIRYLLTKEVQSYLAREAYEIPLVAGVPVPEGLPPLSEIQPPKVDLEKLADLRPTLELLRETGAL